MTGPLTFYALNREIGLIAQKKRATGIEPAWPAWKAGTLPLSYARVFAEKSVNFLL